SSVLYSPPITNATEARQNRRRLLDQQRIAKRGLPCQTTENSQCGHFTKEYIQALKDMEFTLIPNLVPQNRHAVIKVYVSRKWIFRGAMDNGPIHHIDLGNGISAEIPGNLAEEKGSIIEENEIYEISRFTISSARQMFKPVHIDKMIHFTYHTIIKASLDSPSTFPRYVYHLTPLHQIESYIQKNEYFLDVLGVITQVSALKPVRTQTRESSNVIKEIIIKDINDVTMRLTLWAERAKAFKLDDVYNPLEQKPIVTLFVGCLAKNFQGAYLNGGTTCRWYFNPDIKEAAPYYQRFGSQKVKLQIPSEQEQQLSVAKETHVEHKTLHELLALDPYAFPKQGYECTVTIIEVPTTNRWWFPACTKCSRACRPQDGGYYCSYCKSEAYTLRYKLTFMGSDATATAQMFCFDTVARHIVGRPCETVLKQATEATPIPPDLAQIVSLKFTFRVTASNQTFAQREKQPTVLQINSIVVHGRQHYLPSGIQNTIDQGPSTPNKEATLKLLEESPSIAMERLSTKVSKDVGRKLTYSTQDKDIIGSQVLDVAQGTNADKGIPTDKGKEIEPHLQSPPK
ncbi:hypothetical protein ACJX0J_024652, partial [Zea mays]